MAKYIYTVWKRKTASAQVKLFEGAWKDMINGKIISEYVTRIDLFDVLPAIIILSFDNIFLMLEGNSLTIE